MSLISTANLLAKTDYLGYAYQQILALFDTKANVASPTLGTLQKEALNDQALTLSLNDFQQESDLLNDTATVLGKANVEAAAAYLATNISSLNNHIALRGPAVNSSIVDVPSFLSWYNGGDGGAKFRTLVSPQFASLWLALQKTNLPVAGVETPAVHPTLTSGVSAEGMGSRSVGGSFTAGTAVNNSLYSEAVALLEVVTDFANGAAPPAILVAGTDDGGATSTTWSITLTGNNPTAAVSTTITPAVNAMSRQTVAVASLTGIVAGSVLTVNAGLVDQEVIVVEAAGGGNITAAFKLAHLAGAAITGKNTVLLTPSVGGKRIRSVSNITITISSHNAGKVRVVGQQDRVNV